MSPPRIHDRKPTSLLYRMLGDAGYLTTEPAAVAADFADLGAPSGGTDRQVQDWLSGLEGGDLKRVVTRLARTAGPSPVARPVSGLWRDGAPTGQDKMWERVRDAVDGRCDDPDAVAEEIIGAITSMPPLMVPEAAVAKLDTLTSHVGRMDDPVHPARLIDDLLDVRTAITGG